MSLPEWPGLIPKVSVTPSMAEPPLPAAELAECHGVTGTGWPSPANPGNGEKKGLFQCEHLAVPGWG